MIKRLAIFCDGTWNTADQEHKGAPCPTNVLRLASRVARDGGGVPQITYYHQGVGTGNQLDRITGGAFGKGLEVNLYGAYRFLMLNYKPGDEIFLFGFSRGAYTVRSLAGVIRKCGILHPRHLDRYAEVVNIYRNESAPNESGPTNFRQKNSISGELPIPIRMIGVWDTVGSLGIPVRGLRWLSRDKYTFHDVELSGTVQNAYQALAIDERRAPFEASRWSPTEKIGQKVEQVWFCGVHSDVGGGYARDRDKGNLSDITLKWMRDHAESNGLVMDETAERAKLMMPNALGKLHESKTGLYRLTPGINRAIGVPASGEKQPDFRTKERDPTQSLHSSVLERWDNDDNYRPINLVRYLSLLNDPRVANLESPRLS